MSSRYGVLPYRPEFGGSQSGGGGSLADLILRGGDMEAQAHLAKGQIWADTVRGVGDTIGGALQQRSEEKQIAKRDAAWISFLEQTDDNGQPVWMDPKVAALGITKIFGPGEEGQAQLRALGGVIQLGQGKRSPEADQKALMDIGDGMSRVGEPGRALLYPRAYKLMQSAMPEVAAQLPPDYSPELWKEIAPYFSKADAGKPIEVNQNARLWDPNTKQVLLDAVPPEPKMHKVTVPGPGGRPIEKLVTEQELAAGVQSYERPNSPGGHGGGAPPAAADPTAGDRIADAWAAGMAFPSTQAATSAALESFSRRGMPVPRKLGIAMQTDVIRAADTIATIEDVLAAYSKVKGKVGPVGYRLAEWGQKIPGIGADPDFAAFTATLRGLNNLEIKRITGAQMSEAEADRILKAMATGNLKGEEFEAALGVMARNAQRSRDVILYGSDQRKAAGSGSAAGGAEQRRTGVDKRTGRPVTLVLRGGQWVPE